MIGRLKGVLIHKAPPWLVIEVHGVGYELEAPMSTFYDLPEVGREVFLFTHYAQKEDSVSLYGFLREPERVLTREAIAEHVWSYDVHHESNVVDVYIRNLRRKVDDGRERKLLQTVRGAGYRLTERGVGR